MPPLIVLDNVKLQNAQSAVQTEKGKIMLPGKPLPTRDLHPSDTAAPWSWALTL